MSPESEVKTGRTGNGENDELGLQSEKKSRTLLSRIANALSTRSVESIQ
jgi:hypothetical protein